MIPWIVIVTLVIDRSQTLLVSSYNEDDMVESRSDALDFG